MSPKQHLKELLDLLGIKRVVVVDDDFVMTTAAAQRAFGEGGLPELESLPALPEGGNVEEHIEKHWENVSLEDRAKARREASKAGFEQPDPTGLRELLEGPSFIGLTLGEWQSGERDQALGDNRRLLLLFDVDFGNETGKANDTTGLALAADALSSGRQIVGLLTTKADVGDEESSAAVWAKVSDVQAAQFVVVNKQLLGDPGDEGALAEAVEQIRSTLQAARLGKLRQKVREALDDGLSYASDQIESRSPTVLEDLVFQSSHEGGEWEGDTWFRLYGTLGLDRARRSVAIDPEVREAVANVRELLLSRPQPAHDKSKELAAEVDRAESYHDGEYVNGAGLPIANGDIFKAQSGPMYILVGQPCDLALRPDGRAYEPVSATLLPIKQVGPASPAEAATSASPAGKELPVASEAAQGDDEGAVAENSPNNGPDERGSSYLLPDGGPMGDGGWEVRFRPEFHAAFDVLDLCSLNIHGKATTRPATGTELTPLLAGVAKRRAQITAAQTKSQKLLSRIDELQQEKHLSAQQAKQLRQSVLSFCAPFVPTLAHKPAVYDFTCQRLGRLTGSYADALLAAHSNARSRTAHAHELTRIVRQG